MAEKIKILIVDDNENTREGTSRLLEYEDNIEIVGFAENGAEAVDRVRELQPHVVLMDINMPVMNGIDATAQISQQAPRTKVIMVSVQDDSQYLKQAFRAGAVDFVAKPITSAELAQAIERAYSTIQAEPPPMPVSQQQMPAPAGSGAWPGAVAPTTEGRIIGILGFKGGTGKTTLAVNIAVAFAKQGKKTVVVDTNLLFGDVSVFLNSKGQHTIIDFAHLAEDLEQFDHESLATVLVSHESGLKLLIAPANPALSEPVSLQMMTNMLTALKREFEYIIVDTSTGYDDILAAVIQSSDKLLVVTTPIMPSIKNAKILLNDLASFEVMDKALVILNQLDKNIRITPDQIANYLKTTVAAQIPFDPTVNEAINQSIPLISLDPRRAPSVKPLLDVVQLLKDSFEVGQAAEEQAQPAKRSGLFGLGG